MCGGLFIGSAKGLTEKEVHHVFVLISKTVILDACIVWLGGDIDATRTASLIWNDTLIHNNVPLSSPVENKEEVEVCLQWSNVCTIRFLSSPMKDPVECPKQVPWHQALNDLIAIKRWLSI